MSMKLDPELTLQILEKIGIYSNRFSIPEPKMLLSTKEVLDMPREMTEGRRTSAYKYYGVSYLQHNLVFINVRKIPDEKTLENTIVHELIHMRFPYLAHGKRFNKLVRQGLKGKSFLPYRKRSKSIGV
jgi:Zn-dependent peptidase ImmA (M78 family)